MKQKDALMPGSDVEGKKGGGWRVEDEERSWATWTAERALREDMLRELLALRSPPSTVSSLPTPTPAVSAEG